MGYNHAMEDQDKMETTKLIAQCILGGAIIYVLLVLTMGLF